MGASHRTAGWDSSREEGRSDVSREISAWLLRWFGAFGLALALVVLPRGALAGGEERPVDVVVEYAPEREATAESLQTELQIMGFRAELLRRQEGEERRSPTVDGPGVRVSLPEAGGAEVQGLESGERRHVSQSAGEPGDHLALRTAEVTRAVLLGQGRGGARGSHPGSGPSPPSVSSTRRFSATTSQRLVENGFGSAAGGIGQDFSVWFGRFGVGPYLSAFITRQTWDADPKKFAMRWGSLGLQGRYSLNPQSRETFEAQMLAVWGGTALFLREEGGKDEDRFRGVGWGMQAGGGVDFSVYLTRRVKLGGIVLGEGVMLFSWPKGDDRLGNKELELIEAESERLVPRYQVTMALGLTFEW